MRLLTWERTRLVVTFLAILYLFALIIPSPARFAFAGPVSKVTLIAIIMLPLAALIDFIVLLVRWDIVGFEVSARRRKWKTPRD